ncbi:MAG TPA: TIGR03668 family PPOX class F420-dependent oxidoreductase [Thermoanaerobaculia bacterium]|nr:TIGR03668 family PPOX class F420-dependent oxidoreductase [Thermoanaerobaculia bacterium]
MSRPLAGAVAVRVGSVEAPAWAWQALREGRVARLATASAAGAPHLVPVCYVLAGGELWTPIDAKPKTTRALRRVRNLAENPRASLLVDHYEEDWRELRWVLAHGRAELVRGEAAAPALARLRAKYPQYLEVEAGPEAIRLVPERIVAWTASG